MKKFIPILLFSCSFSFLFSSPGDTTHVITHSAVTVTTNPSTGWNPYPKWGLFPSISVSYRKILVNMKYKCPTGWNCGEWDYLDYVIIRRRGSVNDTLPLNMEIARFITPYGNTFTSTWQADWTLDITDYALLLHDSVEIEYQHTGYETNVGKGWSVTLDFILIEGTPVMEPVKITQLWNGSFPFGNASNSIENYLTPDTFTVDSATQVARMRMLQTGHGFDDNNCAEFCQQNRYIYYDGNLADTKLIWRTCGKNASFPQGGTWVYDRGNWCPGATVYPDIYDFNVAGGSTHTLNPDMDAYVSSSPSANYVFGSQLIEFKNPLFTNDATIENIYSPNSGFEWNRMNPICHEPKISIKNNSLTPLTSATIKYGLSGQALFSYSWTGNLQFAQTSTITLPGITVPATTADEFMVYFSDVNGTADQYPPDDTMRVKVKVPAQYDTVFVIYYKTNANPWENDYTLTDASGNIIKQRLGATLSANTVYKDTVHLDQYSCYRIVITDAGGDGLSWWANSSQGTGQLRFQKLAGTAIKNFGSDFGSEIFFEFMTKPVITGMEENEDIAGLNVYPNPSRGNFTLEMKLFQASKVEINVFNALGEKVFCERRSCDTPEIKTTMSLENLPAGIYFLQLNTGRNSITKKIIIEKE